MAEGVGGDGVGVGIVGVSVADGIVSLEPNDSVLGSRIRPRAVMLLLASNLKKNFLI